MDWDTFKRENLTSISTNDANMLDNLAILFDLLIKRRIDLKISQQTLAEKTGLTQSAIARFEAFKVIPRIDTVEKIAQALGCCLVINIDKNKNEN